MKKLKKENKKIAVVCGPAVVHTGVRDYLAKLVDLGYVNLFLGGNAVAVHDLEYAVYQTSLGVGKTASHGHSHHIWTINKINREGGIKKSVESGLVKDGIMHSLIKNNVPFILAGSLRDDGPLIEVITDMNIAQDKTRNAVKDVSLVLMLSTMLHSIGVGNMIPAETITICVDINPATVTKLCDRGSTQAIGIVTDASLFLKILVDELQKV